MKFKRRKENLFLRKITGENKHFNNGSTGSFPTTKNTSTNSTEAAHSFPQMVFFSPKTKPDRGLQLDLWLQYSRCCCQWVGETQEVEQLQGPQRWRPSPRSHRKKLPGGFWKRPRFFLVSKHGWGLLVMAFRSQFVSNEFKNVNACRNGSSPLLLDVGNNGRVLLCRSFMEELSHQSWTCPYQSSVHPFCHAGWNMKLVILFAFFPSEHPICMGYSGVLFKNFHGRFFHWHLFCSLPLQLTNPEGWNVWTKAFATLIPIRPGSKSCPCCVFGSHAVFLDGWE